MDLPQPALATANPAVASGSDMVVSSEVQYQSSSRLTVQEDGGVIGLEREKSWTEVQRKKKTGARNEGKVSIIVSIVVRPE